MKENIIELLEERGVTIKKMAELVYELQKKYIDITMEDAIYNVNKVLSKREVQNAILTGIQLDKLAEKNLIEEPLLSMIKNDESLYGIDEILALSITNVYGSIGFTNYGYIDKMKFGIIGEIDKMGKETDMVNTFLDDLVGGIVAAACARMAHSIERKQK
ncbi:phosphatidylglycerophosphatase A family protein [Thermohalobacter berrensis]|uniref:Phosphatidylglycerophosphatase n=1 Tax=Thermohalobacter berrensis TaxID=99594 RepID=A0A419T4W0_9FIRM|nr:phosphatidylglycerophosphatase A [Thermohalobacter berrensis]RKD32574.1 phosphatidylglycerophosphatase [Thermohalobacter berrensis]